MRINSDKINSEMRKLCTKSFRRKNMDPIAFTNKFREMYPELVEEFKDKAFDIWFRDKAKRLLKNTSYDLRKAHQKGKHDPRTKKLPQMLPLRLTVEGETLSVWVKRKDATLKELILFGEALENNAKACVEKLDAWNEYIDDIKPLLKKHPKWTTADAEAYLLKNRRKTKVVPLKKAA